MVKAKYKWPKHTATETCEFCGREEPANNVFRYKGRKACRGCFHQHTHDKHGEPVSGGWV